MNNIFDRDFIKHNHKRWRNKFKEANFLFEFAETQICERLSMVIKEFSDVAFVGNRNCGIVSSYFSESNVVFTDIGEDEILPFKTSSFDVIISVMELHKVNDIDKVLFQIKHSLKKNGLFLGVIAGGESLKELKHSMLFSETEIYGGVSPRIIPFIDMKYASALMQKNGFSMPVIDSEKILTSYKKINNLYRDLRFMGESNCLINRKKNFSKRQFFEKTEEFYKKNYSENDGRIKASFELIFLSGWNDD